MSVMQRRLVAARRHHLAPASPARPPAGTTPATPAATASDTTLTVYAAASLTKTFQQIGAEFEKQHDGVTVEFSFGGSSDLVSQLQEGAPADVFASADEANMDKLTADDLQADDPQDFASNTLEIATPPDNPAGITSFADLAAGRRQRRGLRPGGAVRRGGGQGRGRHRRHARPR